MKSSDATATNSNPLAWQAKASPAKRGAVSYPALLLPFLASLFYTVWFPGTTLGNSFYTGIKVFLLTWPFVATGLILRERFMHQSGEAPQHRPAIFWGVIFGLVVSLVAAGLLFLTPLGDVVKEGAGNISVFVEKLGVLDHYILFACFLSFIHSALEELYWRWFVYGNLRRLMPLGWAHVIAGLGFASHHVVILSAFFPLGAALFFGLCVGVGGVAWSLLYQRYHSMIGSWVSHAILDIGIMIIGWWLIF